MGIDFRNLHLAGLFAKLRNELLGVLGCLLLNGLLEHGDLRLHSRAEQNRSAKGKQGF